MITKKPQPAAVERRLHRLLREPQLEEFLGLAEGDDVEETAGRRHATSGSWRSFFGRAGEPRPISEARRLGAPKKAKGNPLIWGFLQKGQPQ